MKKRGPMQRMLAIILAVSMMTTYIPTTAFASEQETVSDNQVNETQATETQEQETQAAEIQMSEPETKTAEKDGVSENTVSEESENADKAEEAGVAVLPQIRVDRIVTDDDGRVIGIDAGGEGLVRVEVPEAWKTAVDAPKRASMARSTAAFGTDFRSLAAPMGISSMNRTSTGLSFASSASAGGASSLTPH